MSSALEGKPISDFKKPDKELVDIEVCSESGLLPTFWCPNDLLEYRIFIKGEEPTEVCNIHNKVEVPDVVGLNIEEVRQILEDLYFEVNEISEFNDIYNQNIVFKQEPEASTVLESLTGEKPGITIFVSKGERTFDMINLVGIKKDLAEKIIDSFGLTLENIIYEYNDDQPIDNVFKQDPIANSKVTRSTTVTIYVSKGENPEAIVPDVLGMTEEEALDTLHNSGFTNISVTEEESKEEKDKVFSQAPESSTTYNKSSEIIIKISKGIKVPDVIGADKEDALDELTSLGFIVEIVPDDPEASGKVINQMPESGSYLNYGSTVTIELQVEEEDEELEG